MSDKPPYTITVSRTGRSHGLPGFHNKIERPFLSTEVRFDGTENAQQVRDKLHATIAFLDRIADERVLEELEKIKSGNDKLWEHVLIVQTRGGS